MHSLEELQNQLAINKDDLETELLHQAQLYWESSEGYAEAVSKRDQSKQVLEQVEATLASEFRKSGLTKITEATVAEHVESHPQYVEQYRLYLGYKKEADRWGGVSDAFRDRSHMLRSLVSMFTTGYWNSSSAGAEDRIQGVSEARKRAIENLRNDS